jgi:hypothetical protein
MMHGMAKVSSAGRLKTGWFQMMASFRRAGLPSLAIGFDAPSIMLAYALSSIQQEQALATSLKKGDEDTLTGNKAAIGILIADQKNDQPPKPGTTQQAQDDESQRRAARDAKLKALQVATDEIQKDLLLQNDRVQIFTSLVTRLSAQITKSETFMSGLAVKDGEYPVLLWVLMEEEIPSGNTAIQLGVKVMSQKGSSITRKAFLGSSYYANAAVVLLYTLSSADGQILGTGMVRKGLAYRLPEASSAITVGAITKQAFVTTTFSSRGPAAYGLSKPDIAADGVNVTSTSPVPRDASGQVLPGSLSRGALTTRLSGTSMAAAIVAGAVARFRLWTAPGGRNGCSKSSTEPAARSVTRAWC